jgi:hypothetical protein
MRTSLIAIIIVLIVAIAGGGYYFLVYNNKEAQQDRVYKALAEYVEIAAKADTLNCDKEEDFDKISNDGQKAPEEIEGDLKKLLDEQRDCFIEYVDESIEADKSLASALNSVDCKNIEQLEQCQQYKDDFKEIIEHKERTRKAFYEYYNLSYDYVFCLYETEYEGEDSSTCEPVDLDIVSDQKWLDMNETIDEMREELVKAKDDWKK